MIGRKMAYCPHYRPALLWFLEKYEPLFAYCLCLQAHLYVLIYDMIWYVCTCWEHEKGMDRFLFYRLHKIVIVFITANWEPVMWFRDQIDGLLEQQILWCTLTHRIKHSFLTQSIFCRDSTTTDHLPPWAVLQPLLRVPILSLFSQFSLHPHLRLCSCDSY